MLTCSWYFFIATAERGHVFGAFEAQCSLISRRDSGTGCTVRFGTCQAGRADTILLWGSKSFLQIVRSLGVFFSFMLAAALFG